MGATGSIGRRLVRRLTDAGADVTAFVRDAERGAALDCRYVVGDLDDPDSVAAALRGVDRLFLNGPGAVPVPDGAPQPMIRRQITAVDAARAAGVRYVVKVSVLGPRPGGKLAIGAHWEIERHLERSGVPWTSLRPSGFFQNFTTGTGGLITDGRIAGPFGEGRVGYIDADDIAACAAALLTGDGRRGVGEAYDLTGPEALTHREIAARLGVGYLDVPPADAAAGMRGSGLPAGFTADVLELWAEMAAGGMDVVTTAVRELTGREPRGIDAYARDRAAGHG